MVIYELDIFCTHVATQSYVVFTTGLVDTSETHFKEQFKFISKFIYIENFSPLDSSLFIAMYCHLIVRRVLIHKSRLYQSCNLMWTFRRKEYFFDDARSYS